MTPTAVTPAAQTRKRTARAATGPAPRTGPRTATGAAPRTSPRVAPSRSAPVRPRRVSGPVAPSRTPRPASPARSTAPARTAAAGRTADPARSAPAPRAPRRPAPAAAPTQSRGRRTLSALRGLPDHSLLDRVVRGRLWIPLLGVLLVGIVAAQVEVLKLNASIGHAMVRTAQLQTRNQQLRAAVSEASDDQRVEAAAVRLGMTMPAPTAPVFLGSGHGRLAQALRDIHAPDPSGFALRTQQAQQKRASSVMQTTGA